MILVEINHKHSEDCQIPIPSPSPEFYSDLEVGREEKLLSEEVAGTFQTHDLGTF